MKTFTCKEMGGPCDTAFSGETVEEVGNQGGEHIMTSTDNLHKPIREQMMSTSEEDKQMWWSWFKGEWGKKSE